MGRTVSVPSRGLSYLNAESEYIEKPVISVSVPSRGLSYLNRMKMIYKVTYIEMVSVPSRGLSYLNQKGDTDVSHLFEFPSPHGDSLI